MARVVLRKQRILINNLLIYNSMTDVQTLVNLPIPYESIVKQ